MAIEINAVKRDVKVRVRAAVYVVQAQYQV